MAKDLFSFNIEEMEKASVQFGHRVSKLHPRMKPYLSGVKNGVHTIALEKTSEKLAEALKFIYSLVSEGKNVLLVGTKVPIKEMVKQSAESVNLPYVNERWLGGAFTNFDTILKRVNHFKDLQKQKEQGALDKYTKKERMIIEKEIQSLKTKFNGVRDLVKLPEAVFVSDMRKDELAAKEARKKGIKVIAICDTNTDPNTIDYPIPANDDAISSVKYILDRFVEVVSEAKKEFESKNKK